MTNLKNKHSSFQDRRLWELNPSPSLNRLKLSESSRTFHLLNAYYTRQTDRRTWERNDFPFTCIEYVISGRGTVEIENTVFEARSGDVYILPPGQSHKLTPCSDDLWKKLYAVAYGPLMETLLTLYGLQNKFHFRNCSNSGIPGILDELCRIAVKPPCERNILGAALVTQLIATLAEYKNQAETPLSYRTLEIKLHIDNHLTEPLYLPDLAARFNISQRQLQREFLKEMNCTPYAYYLEQKIRLGKQLLRSSTLSVQDIASKLRFTDAYHFSHIFKDKTGLSPLAYRKNSSAGD